VSLITLLNCQWEATFYRPNIDLSGPLNEDRTLLYRLNAVYEGSEGFRDFDQDVERVFVAPVLTWNISDNTDLTLEFNYLNDERPFDEGLAFGTGIPDIPYDRVFKIQTRRSVEEFGVGYQLNIVSVKTGRLATVSDFFHLMTSTSVSLPGA